MTNKQKYLALTARIEAACGFGFTDMCVDAENCGVKHDDSNEFWAAMYNSLHNSAGMRLSEAGIDPASVGVDY